MQRIKQLFPFFLSLIFFIIDNSSYVLLDYQLIYTVFALWLIFLIKNNKTLIAFTSFLIVNEYFMFYGRPFIALWVLIPVTYLHMAIRRYIYISGGYVALLSFLGLFIQIFYVEPILLEAGQIPSIALTKLVGNVILNLAFFLKFKRAG